MTAGRRRADARGDDDDRGRPRGQGPPGAARRRRAAERGRQPRPPPARARRGPRLRVRRIEAKPARLPLSIGDDDLAETAAELVSVPEMFNYWVGAGRIDVGFLGAAQLDRHANINTTVIGAYAAPEGAAAGRRRGAGDRGRLARGHHPAAPVQARVRREARLHHVDRLRLRARRARAARVQRRGPDGRHHRPRDPPPEPRRPRARAGRDASRGRGRPGARGHRVAAARSRACRAHRAADRRELSTLRELRAAAGRA